MSFMGWFFVITMILAIASVGVRLFPIYLDHNTLDELIEAQMQEEGISRMTNKQFIDRLQTKLKRNNIRDFALKDMLEFERGSGALKVHLKYEMREHLFANVDIVMSFAQDYEKVIG